MNAISVRDQENLAHAHQQVAAAKPLNQGVRGLAPKTPGNNANRNGVNGRTGRANRGQDDENMFLGGGKTGKTGKPTFITPLGMSPTCSIFSAIPNLRSSSKRKSTSRRKNYKHQSKCLQNTNAQDCGV